MKTRIIITALAAATAITACSTQDNTGVGNYQQRMETSTAPGHNFYQYACGKWIAQLPEKPEYSRYNQFDILQEDIVVKVNQLIEDAARGNSPEGSIERKISDYYNLYMDSTRRNAEGAAPLSPYLQMVDQISDRKSATETSARLTSLGISSLFMSIGVDADVKDAQNNIVSLYQGGLQLGNRDYYTNNDSATIKIREAYSQYIINLFVLAGQTQEEAEVHAANVVYIENKIADKNSTKTELRNAEANYHKTRFDSLAILYPGIDWNLYFGTIGYPKIEFVDVSQPAAIKNVAQILGGDDLAKIKSYMKFKIIATGAGTLSDKFVAEDFRMQQALYGTKADKNRNQKAIDEINSKFSMAVGKLYVEKYFPEEAKQKMLNMVASLQDELRVMISELKWMSDQTKEKAIEKLNTFYVKVGYPNKWRDYSTLNIDPKVSLFENNRNVARFMLEYKLAKVNKPIDRDEWGMSPQTINAYYNPTTNEITFPAAILQPPFFDPNGDIACNYGGIGCVIGHEMTHGFDDEGCQFDKNGNLKNWWTEDDKKEFDRRALVLEEYFNKQEVLPGEFANGKLTLGENIADNGGIKISFRALQKQLNGSTEKDASGFTPQQRFFLNYAFIWAGKITEQDMRSRIKNDPHSAMKHRVNCQLPHQQGWYDAFGIQEDSPMYIKPEERVDIW